VTAAIVAARRHALPSETGGVVLGVIDVEAKRIDVVDVGQAPPDSRGTAIAFERGVAGLKDAVLGAQMKTLDQIRYVGEWHSQPQGVPASPSITDLKQVFWLADTLSDDGFPGLMLIVGDASVTATLGALTAPGVVEVEVERAR
jgi:Prokaryotic homologs of the JAB domain